jgi:hypothetical protein
MHIGPDGKLAVEKGGEKEDMATAMKSSIASEAKRKQEIQAESTSVSTGMYEAILLASEKGLDRDLNELSYQQLTSDFQLSYQVTLKQLHRSHHSMYQDDNHSKRDTGRLFRIQKYHIDVIRDQEIQTPLPPPTKLEGCFEVRCQYPHHDILVPRIPGLYDDDEEVERDQDQQYEGPVIGHEDHVPWDPVPEEYEKLYPNCVCECIEQLYYELY